MSLPPLGQAKQAILEQVAFKIETAVGVYETLAGADVIKVFDAKFTRKVDKKKRKPVRGFLGGDQAMVGLRTGSISFKVEMAGSGAAGTAPWWGALLKCCRYKETVAAQTSVAYNSADSFQASASIGFLQDGKMDKLIGCQGSFKIAEVVGEIVIMDFNFEGVYVGQVDQALFTTNVSLPSTIGPAFDNVTCTIDSYSPIFSKCDIDAGNKLAYRKSCTEQASAGATGVLHSYVSDRTPTLKLAIESVAVATKDWVGMLTAGTAYAIAQAWGMTAGNKFSIAAPAGDLQSDADGNEDGRAMDSLDFDLQPSSGNDELTITCL